MNQLVGWSLSFLFFMLHTPFARTFNFITLHVWSFSFLSLHLRTLLGSAACASVLVAFFLFLFFVKVNFRSISDSQRKDVFFSAPVFCFHFINQGIPAWCMYLLLHKSFSRKFFFFCLFYLYFIWSVLKRECMQLTVVWSDYYITCSQIMRAENTCVRMCT